MTQVVLLRVKTYEGIRLRDAVEDALELLDFSEGVASPGEEILVKPNLLASAAPESAVCSQPELLRTVLKTLQARGSRPWVGDSPGFGSVARVARSCGVEDVCRRLNVPLAHLDQKIDVAHPTGGLVQSLPLARQAVEAPGLINVSRLKTHNLTRLSAGVKNLFGCVPGTYKAGFHLRFQRAEDFSALLAEVYAYLRPRLTVVDGIVAMEGPGPRSGNPRPLGVLIVSRDAVAADAVACAVTGLDPWQVPMLRYAHQQGYGQADLSRIEILGRELEEVRVAGFTHVSGSPRTLMALPEPLSRLARNQLTARPLVLQRSCVGCGICRDRCPPGAIRLAGGKAYIEQQSCIRCYCCHELCPHGAIILERGLLGRLSRRLLP